MANFNEIWEKVVNNSPFSQTITYRVGTHNFKEIQTIISEDVTEYETAELMIDIVSNEIEIGENIEFIIDDKVYKVVSFKEYKDIGLTKVWLNGAN